MKRFAMTLLAGSMALALPAMADEMAERTAASKAAVQQFFGELKGELMKAMKEGGPVNAIGVCSAKAPGIAHQISVEKGWKVGRTSLKLRNPANAPDAWERSVLEKFEARKAAGEDPKTMAYAEVVEQDGQKVFRFMKAIPTAEKPCLACHGENLKPAVAAKLDELYPQDQARGYHAGDIRGAFTISQPM
ncbi:Tll0287-like domain-containing protein [Endothiovibrio diazotrophicus]